MLKLNFFKVHSVPYNTNGAGLNLAHDRDVTYTDCFISYSFPIPFRCCLIKSDKGEM